jgi:hypothetical protein
VDKKKQSHMNYINDPSYRPAALAKGRREASTEEVFCLLSLWLLPALILYHYRRQSIRIWEKKNEEWSA